MGAHLTSMPLNFQLTSRNATLLKKTQTADAYKLFALKIPHHQSQSMQCDAEGTSIEVEVWDVPLANFGAIVAEVPAPLGIGNLKLKDGTWVKGFICEAYAIQDAIDISHFEVGELTYSHSIKPLKVSLVKMLGKFLYD